MNLEISNVNNLFKVKGVLNRKNVDQFQQQLISAFDALDTIILNIQGLESIDRHGVSALAKLHNDSLVKQKSLSIIGYGCKEIYDYFKAEEAA